MKKTTYIILLLTFLTSNKISADMIGYSESLKLRIESKKYIIIHFHDWSDATRESRYEMISTDQNPFNKKNNYAYIMCIDKATRKVLFKRPCSALTKIEISQDEKYIVGISKIKLWNPYQLLVYSINGELIKKRNIECEEAKLEINQLKKFKCKFPKEYVFLESDSRVFKVDNSYYINFMSMGMPQKLGTAWSYLFKYSCGNHLSDNFSESVTNWIFWFYEKNPQIKFNYKKEKIYSIALLDPKRKWIEIKIKE